MPVEEWFADHTMQFDFEMPLLEEKFYRVKRTFHVSWEFLCTHVKGEGKFATQYGCPSVLFVLGLCCVIGYEVFGGQ
jgi:hypothetical protein